MWCSEGQAGRQDRQSQSSLLTVEAMLRIKESKQQGGSALSDEADIGSVSECLDWAGCLANVLQDTMALVRIVKLTLPSPTLRGPAPGSTTASRSWPTRVLSTTS